MKIGWLCSGSRSQWRFRISVSVFLDDIFWTLKWINTSSYTGVSCKNLGCCLQRQGHSEGLYRLNMDVSATSFKLLLFLQSNLLRWYIIKNWMSCKKYWSALFMVKVFLSCKNYWSALFMVKVFLSCKKYWSALFMVKVFYMYIYVDIFSHFSLSTGQVHLQRGEDAQPWRLQSEDVSRWGSDMGRGVQRLATKNSGDAGSAATPGAT